MVVNLRQLINKMALRPPASIEVIRHAERKLGFALPDDYKEFLKLADGGEGFIGQGGFVHIYPVSDLPRVQEAYNTQTFAPGFLLFGSDGGGEAFGYDTRESWDLVKMPFIAMEWEDAIVEASSFIGFLERMRDQ